MTHLIHKMMGAFTPKTDPQGGIVIPEEDTKRAKSADLITLPQGVPGKNCSTCDFMDKDSRKCKNRALVGIQVNEHMGCKLWYHTGIYESWAHVDSQSANNK